MVGCERRGAILEQLPAKLKHYALLLLLLLLLLLIVRKLHVQVSVVGDTVILVLIDYNAKWKMRSTQQHLLFA